MGPVNGNLRWQQQQRSRHPRSSWQVARGVGNGTEWMSLSVCSQARTRSRQERFRNKMNKKGGEEPWVKVYNEKEGIIDFSSDSESVVSQRRIVDDGRVVLDDDQIQEAYENAGANVASSSVEGFTVSVLASETKQTPKVPKKDEQKG